MGGRAAHVFVLDVLEELELAVSALREDGGVEGLHDLLDRDRGAGELVLCGTGWRGGEDGCATDLCIWTYQTSPKAPVNGPVSKLEGMEYEDS